jgi:hypothetical protein
MREKIDNPEVRKAMRMLIDVKLDGLASALDGSSNGIGLDARYLSHAKTAIRYLRELMPQAEFVVADKNALALAEVLAGVPKRLRDEPFQRFMSRVLPAA